MEVDSGSGLLVEVEARSWGSNYGQFAAEGRSSCSLGVTDQRTGINAVGSELRMGFQAGEDPRIADEWYQPLEALSRYFVNTNLGEGATSIGCCTVDGGDHLADRRRCRFIALYTL